MVIFGTKYLVYKYSSPKFNAARFVLTIIFASINSSLTYCSLSNSRGEGEEERGVRIPLHQGPHSVIRAQKSIKLAIFQLQNPCHMPSITTTTKTSPSLLPQKRID